MSLCACNCGGTPKMPGRRFVAGHNTRMAGGHPFAKPDRNSRILTFLEHATHAEAAIEFNLSRGRIGDIARARKKTCA